MISQYFAKILKNAKKALIIGMGGGGDVLGALPTRNFLESYGIDCELASLTYERSKYDPEPGPRRFEEIENIEEINETIAIASDKTKTHDGLEFQASKMSRFLNENIILIDISKGVKGVYEGLKDLIIKNKLDILIGIDVGGDVVASGYEKGLRSPLTDAIILSSLVKVNEESIIGVYGAGCDGELTLDEISRNFALIYSNSGFIGCITLNDQDVDRIRKGSKIVNTEASKLPILIADGKTGNIKIRDGLRAVNLSFFSIFTYYFKSKIVYDVTKSAKAISNSKSFLEANNILRKLGITTEYDLQLKKRIKNLL